MSAPPQRPFIRRAVQIRFKDGECAGRAAVEADWTERCGKPPPLLRHVGEDNLDSRIITKLT